MSSMLNTEKNLSSGCAPKSWTKDMCGERHETAGPATIQPLEEHKQETKRVKLGRIARATPTTISITFIVPGILALTFSVAANSSTLAFVGLGLTFWGALFLFIKPTRYVQSAILDSIILPAYANIDRIVKDMKLKGRACYVPPYPEDVYLPEHLKGLKDMVMFISMDTTVGTPSVEELAEGKFLFENTKGVCMVPPGAGLFAHFENQLKLNLTKMQINELCENLTELITENLMAKEAKFLIEENRIQLRLADSTCGNLYIRKDIRCIGQIGCPIVSAVACAIAKTTGKTVSIGKILATPDAKTIVARYEM